MKIKILNKRSLDHKDVEKFYSKTVDILGKYAVVLKTNEEIQSFIQNPLSFSDKALIIVDDWQSKTKRNWNYAINSFLTSGLVHSNIVVCTQAFLTKTLLRQKGVEIIKSIQ